MKGGGVPQLGGAETPQGRPGGFVLSIDEELRLCRVMSQMSLDNEDEWPADEPLIGLSHRLRERAVYRDSIALAAKAKR